LILQPGKWSNPISLEQQIVQFLRCCLQPINVQGSGIHRGRQFLSTLIQQADLLISPLRHDPIVKCRLPQVRVENVWNHLPKADPVRDERDGRGLHRVRRNEHIQPIVCILV
jgi:hypothetical protein